MISYIVVYENDYDKKCTNVTLMRMFVPMKKKIQTKKLQAHTQIVNKNRYITRSTQTNYVN